MHINVRDLLAEETGYNRTFAIEGERPPTLSINLTEPINGDVTLTKLDGEQLLAHGSIATQLELECHRCLRSYSSDVERRFEQVFATSPAEDELPIEKYEIDLAPLFEQEIIVGLPIKQICEEGCNGIPGAEDYYVNKQGS